MAYYYLLLLLDPRLDSPGTTGAGMYIVAAVLRQCLVCMCVCVSLESFRCCAACNDTTYGTTIIYTYYHQSAASSTARRLSVLLACCCPQKTTTVSDVV